MKQLLSSSPSAQLSSAQLSCSDQLFIMSSDSLKHLVNLLKRPPFNISVSLVELSNKSSLDLLQLVNDVLAKIDSSQSKNIADEGEEQRARRMLDFLVVLGYKLAIEGTSDSIASFGTAFLSAEKSVIFPLLLWLLDRVQLLKKRAYLARYLRPVNIPEDLFADAAIVSAYQKFSSLQAEFKDLHKLIEGQRDSSLNPKQLSDEVKQIELEREQLQNKLNRLNNKIQTDQQFEHVNFTDILTATNQLRQEQEEENKLYQANLEQKHKLLRSEQLKNSAMKKYSEMANNPSAWLHADANKLYNKLRAEINDKRNYEANQLNNLINEREKQLKSLAKVLNNDMHVSESELDDLLQTAAQLKSEVEQLEANLTEANNKTDGQLGFLRDRTVGAEKRKDKLLEQLNELQSEQKEVEDDVRRLNNDLRVVQQENSSIMGENKPKTDAEHKSYMAELAVKTQNYKNYKHNIEVIKEEINILVNTEQLLRSNAKDLTEFNKQLELQKGVSGFIDTEDKLNSIANIKANIDSNKGETLEEISQLVDKINATLKERKNKLAPQIKELRSIRQQFEDVEAVYLEKKQQYNQMSAGYETERIKLEADCSNNKQQLQQEESHYHFLNSLTKIAKIRAEVCEAQGKYESGAQKFPNPAYKSYVDHYEKEIMREEQRAKQLRQEKKFLTDSHNTNIIQRQLFHNLRSLLQLKYQSNPNNNNNNHSNDPNNSSHILHSSSNNSSSINQLLSQAETLTFD
jgi:intraflagellar transport protein 81